MSYSILFIRKEKVLAFFYSFPNKHAELLNVIDSS